MNRMLSTLIAGLIFLTVLCASIGAAAQTSQSPSLGDYARAIKKNKPESQKATGKVYDNDNLPRNTSVSIVGRQPETTSDDDKQGKDQNLDPSAKSDEKDKAKEKSEESPQIKPGQAPEERQAAVDSWKQKLSDQKTKVDLLSRELDVLNREYQIKVSEFYSNTAMRAQNPSAIMADDAKYKQQIADRQKSLDEAKSKFEDLQEQARKSGVPSSQVE
jgi:hypothetical protein